MIEPLFLDPIHPCLESLKTLYDWKYSQSVLKNSFSAQRKSFEEFEKSYSLKFHALKNYPPLWIVFENKKVGVIYLEPGFKKDEAQISLFLSPSFQHRSIGLKALEKASRVFFQQGLEHLSAYVKEENKAAQSIFKKAGYTHQGLLTVEKYGLEHLAFRFALSKTSSQSQTFIIAEIGSNFCLGEEKKSLELAKKMMEKAVKAGADAVKFQLFSEKTIYVSNAGVASYLQQDINEIFKQHTLPKSFIAPLSNYAKYLGVEFLCSTFSQEDFKSIDPYVQKHKIASYELRHLRLLELAAQSQKPLFLSTAAATEKDIAWAKNFFFEKGGTHLTLMHCTAQYPAQSAALNLRCIETLKSVFNTPVGLSDHSKHPLFAPLAAVALGAVALEKHVTLHSDLPGPDHSFAINFKEFEDMCFGIRETEKILGLAKKEIFPQEEELAAFARRGLQALKPIQAGEPLEENFNVGILRPGMQKLGIHPKYLEQLKGKRAAKDIPIGSGLQIDDIEW